MPYLVLQLLSKPFSHFEVLPHDLENKVVLRVAAVEFQRFSECQAQPSELVNLVPAGSKLSIVHDIMNWATRITEFFVQDIKALLGKVRYYLQLVHPGGVNL